MLTLIQKSLLRGIPARIQSIALASKLITPFAAIPSSIISKNQKNLLSFRKRNFSTVPEKPSQAPSQQEETEEEEEEEEEPLIVELNYTNFTQYVSKSKIPVLIDCYAE